MSYEFYKILHFSSLFILSLAAGAQFYAPKELKWPKIIVGISSLSVLVAGMGLIAKGLGISHGETWPLWLKSKVAIWLLIAIGIPMMSKRGQMRSGAILVVAILMVIQVLLVAFRPGD